MRHRSLAVLLCVMALAPACSSKPSPQPTPASPSPSPRPSSTAQLTIVSPKNGDQVTGSIVHVQMQLVGASIVPFVSTTLRPDQGHIHIKLDGVLQTMTAKLGTDVKDVKPGAHVLEAEFVANDHAPFFPRVTAAVSFGVR